MHARPRIRRYPANVKVLGGAGFSLSGRVIVPEREANETQDPDFFRAVSALNASLVCAARQELSFHERPATRPTHAAHPRSARWPRILPSSTCGAGGSAAGWSDTPL